ncbi:MAG: AraC family ligand binding domain-containing protein [Nostoc sp.]|uniref:AraC family ligand binding domain-containing protein n=1 Tax=Nostoc sp. TaxID=1180 RepID=UPI002FF85321
MNSDITIGYVRTDLQSLHDWTHLQFGMKSMSSSRVASGRTHKWFGYEVILLKPNAKIKKGHWDARVNRLGDCILPGWNCALLCHYRPSGGMIEHCDHSVFEALVALVNIGRATFRIDHQEHHLKDGQVIKFNSNIPHELLPVVSDRWSLSFRRIKPQSLRF